MLPLATPRAATAADPASWARPREGDDFSSQRTGDSSDWSSDNSKQDSKDLPWGRSHLETVKKCPPHSSLDGSGGGEEGAAPQRLALPSRGAVALSLFAAVGQQPLGDVQEREEELDQSVYDVELGIDDLRQLDADVHFSDLEEDRLSWGCGGGEGEDGGESGDEDFDFDEPMLGLPQARLEPEERGGAAAGVREGVKTLQAELAESRVGEGQESEEEDGGGTNTALDASNGKGGRKGWFCFLPIYLFFIYVFYINVCCCVCEMLFMYLDLCKT